MTKKKVLIIYSGAKIWGGIETYLENLFKYYDHDKLELVLVSMGEWELTNKLESQKYKVKSLSGKRIRFKTISEIAELTKAEKANLIVSQGVVANFYARLAAKKAKIPQLTTIHSNLEYDYPDGAIRLAYRLSDRLFRRNTSHFITVSKYLKDELVRSGISASKVTAIYNGIDEEAIKSTSSSHMSTVKGLTTVGSIGRFHYTKGYHNLIEAFTYLRELPVNLVIYGDGEERKSLEELIERLDLSDKVVLPGYTRNIGSVLANLNIYVQSSLMEGFGLTVIEAMLAGRPTIVTPVGSLPELVNDGKTGLITGDTEPESIAVAIKTLVENKELAKKLANEGQIEAKKKYSIKKWLNETEKVYLGATK
ncbi:MAG: glycosyltransferase family 4 protein [Patescibacteria group bacterium]|nr:glycosyltransferase family 4 protein [Patescibacteria group bacterium]